jgi:hypothetical protein
MTTMRKKLVLAAATLMLTALTLGGASAAKIDCAAACPKASPCPEPCSPCPDCPLSGCPKQAR